MSSIVRHGLAAVALGAALAGLSHPQDTTPFQQTLKLTEQGDAVSQLTLGVMYASGHGVPENHAEAVKLGRLAAARGNESAAKNKEISREGMTPAQISESQRLSTEWNPK